MIVSVIRSLFDKNMLNLTEPYIPIDVIVA